jgi:hypothetical protein
VLSNRSKCDTINLPIGWRSLPVARSFQQMAGRLRSMLATDMVRALAGKTLYPR